MNTILLVDDDDKIRNNLIEYLATYGYVVDESSSSSDAIKKIRENKYMLIITDVLMEHSTAGIELLNLAKEQDENIKVIVFSAYMTEEIRRNKKIFKSIDKNSENAYKKIVKAIKYISKERNKNGWKD